MIGPNTLVRFRNLTLEVKDPDWRPATEDELYLLFDHSRRKYCPNTLALSGHIKTKEPKPKKTSKMPYYRQFERK